MSNVKAQGSHYIMQPGAPRKFSKLCLIRGFYNGGLSSVNSALFEGFYNGGL